MIDLDIKIRPTSSCLLLPPTNALPTANFPKHQQSSLSTYIPQSLPAATKNLQSLQASKAIQEKHIYLNNKNAIHQSSLQRRQSGSQGYRLRIARRSRQLHPHRSIPALRTLEPEGAGARDESSAGPSMMFEGTFHTKFYFKVLVSGWLTV